MMKMQIWKERAKGSKMKELIRQELGKFIEHPSFLKKTYQDAPENYNRFGKYRSRSAQNLTEDDVTQGDTMEFNVNGKLHTVCNNKDVVIYSYFIYLFITNSCIYVFTFIHLLNTLNT